MASVAHTLTQRVSVSVRNMTDPVEIYKAYNLLSFYHDMFRKLIRHSTSTTASNTSHLEKNTLLSTLTNLQSQVFKHFETTALESLHLPWDETPHPDLSPPSALAETLSQFSKIALTRGPNLDGLEFAKLYTTLVKPVLDSCKSLADNLAGSPSEHDPDTYTRMTPSLIYRLNYMSLVRDTLAPLAIHSTKISAAEEPLHQARTEIDLCRASLTEQLQDHFLLESGLDELNDVLAEIPTGATDTTRKAQLWRRSDLGSQSRDGPDRQIERLAAKLDTFLASALMDTHDDLGKLIDREIAASVVQAAVGGFCDEFDKTVVRLENIDDGAERERLAKSMGQQTADNNVNGEVGEDQEEEGPEDREEMPTLREVYPRTLDEVRALLT